MRDGVKIPRGSVTQPGQHKYHRLGNRAREGGLEGRGFPALRKNTPSSFVLLMLRDCTALEWLTIGAEMEMNCAWRSRNEEPSG